MVSKFGAPFVKIFALYPTGCFTLSSCFCDKRQALWRSHASLSKVYRTSFLGNPKNWGEIRFTCKVLKAICCSLFNCSSAFPSDWRCLAVIGDVTRENFGTKRRNTLREPIIERRSVCDFGIAKTGMASVVFLVISTQPGRIP